MRPCSLLLLVLLAGSCTRTAQQPALPAAAATFTNPLLPAGADPWSIYHNGYYYYTHTTGRNIRKWP